MGAEAAAVTIRAIIAKDGKGLFFPDDCDGLGIDQIEQNLCQYLGFKPVRQWSTPLEEVRLLHSCYGDLVLRWDGFLTELVAVAPLDFNDLLTRMRETGAFS
jgi:hypothetical protein